MRGRLRDPHLAEDVTQAVFLLLAQKAARLKPDISLSGWLFRTATLTSANAMKMQRRRIRREARAATAAAAAAAHEASAQRGATGMNTAHESELLAAIDTALARLRPHDREVLLMRFYGNKSVTEVAADLGITIDASKKRFTRARCVAASAGRSGRHGAGGRRDDDALVRRRTDHGAGAAGGLEYLGFRGASPPPFPPRPPRSCNGSHDRNCSPRPRQRRRRS